MKRKSTIIAWLGIPLLIAIDQTIKLLIFHFFMMEMPLIPPLFYFKPIFNRNYSWLNSMLELGISRSVHIVFTALLLLFIFTLYLFVLKRYSSPRLCQGGFLFLISGASCSLIDKIFWNGSLDYIYLNGFFTFDLKDLFLNIAIILFLIFLLTNWKKAEQFDEKNFFKEYFSFLFPFKKEKDNSIIEDNL